MTEDRPPLWIAPAALVLGLAGAFVVTAIVDFAGTAFGSPLANPTPATVIVGSAGFDLAFVLAALYFWRIGGGVRATELGFQRLSLWRGTAIVVAAAIGYYVVTTAYSAIVNLTGTDKLPSEFGTGTGTAALILTAAFVCVVAPIFEEFFFRGFLFGVLRHIPLRLGGRELGPWLAAVLVGVLFGAAHTGSASSAQFLIPLGFFGFVLCLVRWRTGSLYPCIVLHSLNNAAALGVNELRWGALPIVALAAGSLAVVLGLTLPLAGRAPAGAAVG